MLLINLIRFVFGIRSLFFFEVDPVGEIIKTVILVGDLFPGDLYDPHPRCVGPDLTSDGRGDDDLEVTVPAPGVAMVVAAEDLTNASLERKTR